MLRSLLSLAVCASAAIAADVPLLMWSPSSQISQLQERQYTVPLSAVEQQVQDASGNAKALVLFLQDQFSHFDFSRFRGLDGESFRQLEDALQQSMSQILPAVEKAGEIEQVMSKLAAEVQEIADADDVEKLDLGDGKKLVIVRMPSPSTTGKASQFAQNDALVGAVTKKVAELTSNNYVAVWTASKPSAGCTMEFAAKMRNRRQAAPTTQETEKDYADYQDRYFSQTSITVMIIVLLFVTILCLAIFPTTELQTPVRFQDPSVPMVGKE